jgi:hypothetical protein
MRIVSGSISLNAGKIHFEDDIVHKQLIFAFFWPANSSVRKGTGTLRQTSPKWPPSVPYIAFFY